MNKVTTVNLNGRAYQVEEQAYEALRAYLDEAARLLADDPDCKEIMADLEQAIGDKGARLPRSRQERAGRGGDETDPLGDGPGRDRRRGDGRRA